MTAATSSLRIPPQKSLRPFDLRKDLLSVADLVEECFADTLDLDGQRFIQQMRSSARNAALLGWAAAAADRVSMPLGGFVWEQDEQLVGNLSLIPTKALGKRSYLIANVAVHPNYRRMGIARALTEAALEHLRRRGLASAWLQVRRENQIARLLYQGLDFEERAIRTTWHSQPASLPEAAPDVVIAQRHSKHWEAQRAWLREVYPPNVRWHLPINMRLLRPGLGGALARLVSDRRIWQWSAMHNGQLIGALSWQSSHSQADHLWAAARMAQEEIALRALLLHARKRLPRQRALSVDYPADRAAETFASCGFYAHQNLVWMERKL